MALTVKLLKAKIGVAGEAAVYTPPTGKSAVIQTMSLVNTHTTNPATFTLFFVSGANTRRLCEQSTVLPVGGQVIFDDLVTLGPNDSVKVEPGSTSVIDAIICGVERDV